MRLKKNAKSFGFIWMISFLKILIIPMITLCILCYKYDRRLDLQNQEFNKYIFDRTTKNISDILYYMREISIAICSDTNFNSVMSISSYEEYFKNNSFYDYIKEIKSLKKYKQNDYNYYIYCEDTDCIISNSGVLNTLAYYDTYMSPREISYEEWMNIIQPKNHVDFYNITVSDDSKRDIISYVTSPFKSEKKYNASIVIEMNKNNFFSATENIEWVNKCDLYIFDTNQNLVAM